VGRLLAAAIEEHHDERGVVFPTPIAPYHVSLTALNTQDQEVTVAAEALYDELQGVGVQVLYDDRRESAGVKFNDADLLGLPVRLVVSPRNLRQGVVEVERRSESEAATVPREQVLATVQELLSD
jgi:prolyl-tRNA synthetase